VSKRWRIEDNDSRAILILYSLSSILLIGSSFIESVILARSLRSADKPEAGFAFSPIASTQRLLNNPSYSKG